MPRVLFHIVMVLVTALFVWVVSWTPNQTDGSDRLIPDEVATKLARFSGGDWSNCHWIGESRSEIVCPDGRRVRV